MKATRVFQLTALALVVVAAVQVGWWLFDQRSYALERVAVTRALHAQEVAAAQLLLADHRDPQQVQALFPALTVRDGKVEVSAASTAALDAEVQRRMTQYLWEGAFFVVALCVCIAVIARALREEERVIREQDEFLALVSHQFKTPLASLQLSLETLALRGPDPTLTRTLTDRMLSDLARMSSMVSRILESVRLERGRVPMRREPIDLAAAVSRIVAQYEERARRERIELHADLPRGLIVLADPLALDVIVRNLIENALVAVARAGGGRVGCSAHRLREEIELIIDDSGVGFSPAEAGRLFTKFSRLSAARAAGGGDVGTGLGLYIVRRLMQLAGGRVSAHSEGEGRGARFVLTWPTAPAEAA